MPTHNGDAWAKRTPPLARLTVAAEEEAMIRRRVRAADPAELGSNCVLANHVHVSALVDFLSDPRVSDPIFDLPRPFTPDNVSAWIATDEAARQRGDAIPGNDPRTMAAPPGFAALTPVAIYNCVDKLPATIGSGCTPWARRTDIETDRHRDSE